MPSRDIWSSGVSRQLSDLLGSVLMTILMRKDVGGAAYFCSPWMSNFVVARNAFDAFTHLVPAWGDKEEIRFADYLPELARSRPVRLVTVDTQTSRRFLALPELRGAKVAVRYASDGFHEKGVLAPGLYLEGSMNLTFNGVHSNTEKVTYHVGGDPLTDDRIARAGLEFERRWGAIPE